VPGDQSTRGSSPTTSRANGRIGDDVLEAVDRVGYSGWLVLGEEVRAFELEFATWRGVPRAVGVASGLDALESIRWRDSRRALQPWAPRRS
jgi:dTDP-4-amino-4,6-dideoxygalactose transaminase